MENQTELEKRNILRMNSREANAITRECIESALVLLMKEKSFSEISIQDIIRKAGVGRSSYYRNYDSKEAILMSHMENIIQEGLRTMTGFDPKNRLKESWLAMLDNAKTHGEDYLLLLNAGFGDSILRKFMGLFNDRIQQDEVEEYITNNYFAGCIYATLSQWVLDGMKIPAEKMADICTRLMQDGMRGMP